MAAINYNTCYNLCIYDIVTFTISVKKKYDHIKIPTNSFLCKCHTVMWISLIKNFFKKKV